MLGVVVGRRCVDHCKFSIRIFRPVIRRLNDAERAMYIRSGSVFVWEETEEAIGLRRVSDCAVPLVG